MSQLKCVAKETRKTLVAHSYTLDICITRTNQVDFNFIPNEFIAGADIGEHIVSGFMFEKSTEYKMSRFQAYGSFFQEIYKSTWTIIFEYISLQQSCGMCYIFFVLRNNGNYKSMD